MQFKSTPHSEMYDLKKEHDACTFTLLNKDLLHRVQYWFRNSLGTNTKPAKPKINSKNHSLCVTNNWILKSDFAYLELGPTQSRLNEAHIRRPIPSPIVFTIGTTVILPRRKHTNIKQIFTLYIIIINCILNN